MTVKTFMHLTLLLTESNKILKSEFELTLLNYSKIKKNKTDFAFCEVSFVFYVSTGFDYEIVFCY